MAEKSDSNDDSSTTRRAALKSIAEVAAAGLGTLSLSGTASTDLLRVIPDDRRILRSPYERRYVMTARFSLPNDLPLQRF